MAEYYVTLDDAEIKAMEYVAADVQDWIDNLINFKIQTCTDEFLKRYIEIQQAKNEEIITNTDLLIQESTELPASQRMEEKNYKIFPDDPFNPSLIP